MNIRSTSIKCLFRWHCTFRGDSFRRIRNICRRICIYVNNRLLRWCRALHFWLLLLLLLLHILNFAKFMLRLRRYFRCWFKNRSPISLLQMSIKRRKFYSVVQKTVCPRYIILIVCQICKTKRIIIR